MSYDPQPGMRVVCIDDDWVFPGPSHPLRGKVYTIKSVEVEVPFRGRVHAGPYLGFHECPGANGGRPEFHARCFKPLDETRLDVFRQHLTRAPGPRERVGA